MGDNADMILDGFLNPYTGEAIIDSGYTPKQKRYSHSKRAEFFKNNATANMAINGIVFYLGYRNQETAFDIIKKYTATTDCLSTKLGGKAQYISANFAEFKKWCKENKKGPFRY